MDSVTVRMRRGGSVYANASRSVLSPEPLVRCSCSAMCWHVPGARRGHGRVSGAHGSPSVAQGRHCERVSSETEAGEHLEKKKVYSFFWACCWSHDTEPPIGHHSEMGCASPSSVLHFCSPRARFVRLTLHVELGAPAGGRPVVWLAAPTISRGVRPAFGAI